MKRTRKVLMLGIDAMDFQIAKRLIGEEKLPNFKRLYLNPLSTTMPPETPVAWSAIATGTNPGKYGIFDFITRDPNTYLPKLDLATEKPGLIKVTYESNMRGIPFWRILTENNISATVLRWPVTFPPEKVRGRMLSGLGVVDIAGSLNNYRVYTTNRALPNPDASVKTVFVENNGGKILSELYGPIVKKRGETKKITTPLEVTVRGQEAEISVGSQKFTLQAGSWSPWVQVTFKPLAFHSMQAICMFYLISTAPHFSLYVSSIQIDPQSQAVPITAPENYGKELVENVGLFHTLGMPEETKAVSDGWLSTDAFNQQVKIIEAERERMFWYEFNRFTEGALAIIFDAGDRLQHIFWRHAGGNPRHGEIPKEIEAYYRDKDRLLGEILSKLDDTTALVVLSDHGFSSFERAVNINSWLVKEGYMELTDRADTELFCKVDWSKTAAYSVGFTSIFLNLEGRESRGIVSADMRDALRSEISAKLMELSDGKRKVCSNVYSGKDLYHGLHTEHAPDLVVGFNEGYRMSWRSAIGAVEEEIVSENDSKWCGDHLVDHIHVPGVLFTNFETKGAQYRGIDVAPTVLRLLGLEVPQSMDGVALI